MHSTSQAECGVLSTHCWAMKLVSCESTLLRQVNARAMTFACLALSPMAYTSPSSQAAEALARGSSRYIVIATKFPAYSGSDRLSMKRGFIPRGRLPKLNNAPNEDTLHSIAKERATPPPMSLPCTAAAVKRGSFRMDVASLLFWFTCFNISC